MEEKKNEQRELGRDEVFAEVKEVIESVEKSRMVAEAGSKHGLKRNPYQTLKEKGLMNPDFILSEFDKIQAKASNLSSGERDVISKIMMMALHNAAVKDDLLVFLEVVGVFGGHIAAVDFVVLGLLAEDVRVGLAELLLVERLSEALASLFDLLVHLFLDLAEIVLDQVVCAIPFLGILIVDERIVEGRDVS